MRNRKGDWRDVLSAYTLALDAKKLYLGFVATLITVLIMAAAAVAYSVVVRQDNLASIGMIASGDFIVRKIMMGEGMSALRYFLPMFNPFHAGLLHFIVSVVFYVVLLRFWSYYGGVITRITALEYGRDELPTLADGTSMVNAKRNAYFFAPISPLIGVVIFGLLNALGGLVGSIPYVGPILMVLGIVPWLISTIIMLFIIVLGVLSFGLMFPAISIGGKDAFEGWSSAYSYLLWGFSRFVGYSFIACLIGVVGTVAAWLLAEFFIYILTQTINIGLITQHDWVVYTGIIESQFSPAIEPSASPSTLMKVTSCFMVAALMAIRALPAAFLFAYFFTSNTVICFLMRKHVDRIELDEVYEEEPEEEEPPVPPLGEEEEEEEEPEFGMEEEEAPEPETEEEAPEVEEEEEEPEEEPEEEAPEAEEEPDEAPEVETPEAEEEPPEAEEEEEEEDLELEEEEETEEEEEPEEDEEEENKS